jgi:hypothetical protein
VNEDALVAWTTGRSGAVFPESRMGELSAALVAATGGEVLPRRWHPMRSPWWIIPFALLLGYEWWARRRRGLP